MNASFECKRYFAPVLALLFLLAACLAGCGTVANRNIGRQVPAGNRVALQDGGPHAQVFQTKDMTIKYQYWSTENHLKVQGTTAIRYESINELIFHLYFLDGQGSVIAVHDFYSFLDHNNFTIFRSDMRQFHRDFSIPAGAKAFTIGYDGDTTHSADQAEMDFSHSPFE